MTTATLTHTFNRVELAEGSRRAAQLRALREERAPDGAQVTVRALHDEDGAEVERLAQRDSRSVPAAPLLGAEVDGTLVAAIAPRTGIVLSDPFASSSASAVELLRLRAQQLAPRAATTSRLRRLASGRTPLVLLQRRHRQAG